MKQQVFYPGCRAKVPPKIVCIRAALRGTGKFRAGVDTNVDQATPFAFRYCDNVSMLVGWKQGLDGRDFANTRMKQHQREMARNLNARFSLVERRKKGNDVKEEYTAAASSGY